MIEYISNPYIISILISIIITIIIYYTKDVKDNNINKYYYLKIFIISLILINIILYFLKPYLLNQKSNIQNGGFVNKKEKVLFKLNVDDIHTGIPDF